MLPPCARALHACCCALPPNPTHPIHTHTPPPPTTPRTHTHTHTQWKPQQNNTRARTHTAKHAAPRPRRSVLVANVGDSRAVVGEKRPGNEGFLARDLSIDQTPYRRAARVCCALCARCACVLCAVCAVCVRAVCVCAVCCVLCAVCCVLCAVCCVLCAVCCVRVPRARVTVRTPPSPLGPLFVCSRGSPPPHVTRTKHTCLTQ
jgi:hypothetical protein